MFRSQSLTGSALRDKRPWVGDVEAEARKLNDLFLGSTHLVLAALRNAGPTLTKRLESSGVSADELYDRVVEQVSRRQRRSIATIGPRAGSDVDYPCSNWLLRLVERAEQEARNSDASEVRSEHVLSALMAWDVEPASVLRSAGVTLDLVRGTAPPRR